MNIPEPQGREEAPGAQADAGDTARDPAAVEEELEKLLSMYLPRLKQFAVYRAVRRYGRVGEFYASDIVQSIIRGGLPALREGLRSGQIRNPYAWLCQRVDWKLGEINKNCPLPEQTVVDRRQA